VILGLQDTMGVLDELCFTHLPNPLRRPTFVQALMNTSLLASGDLSSDGESYVHWNTATPGGYEDYSQRTSLGSEESSGFSILDAGTGD